MRFKKYTISMGLNDKDSLAPVADYESAKLEVAGRLAQLGVGATITKGVGVYKHERGDVVIEETVVIAVIDFDGGFEAVAEAFYEGLKRDYNQESVAVEVATVESELK